MQGYYNGRAVGKLAINFTGKDLITQLLRGMYFALGTGNPDRKIVAQGFGLSLAVDGGIAHVFSFGVHRRNDRREKLQSRCRQVKFSCRNIHCAKIRRKTVRGELVEP